MPIDFDAAFRLLSGHDAMPWQKRLYWKFEANRVPRALEIPTGLGKTSVMLIWLIALCQRQSKGDGQLGYPRRLVYTVDRRTLVDSASALIEDVREKLATASEARPDLWAMRNALKGLAPASARDDSILAVSSLRGERIDNREWSADPAQAGVVVGTVDMLGSRLLFDGYGDGRYHRSYHAGLLGVDTLWVHDEAHLSAPFGKLLSAVQEMQSGTATPSTLPPMRVMEMSATAASSDAGCTMRLTAEDMRDPTVKRRMSARKPLVIERVPKKSNVVAAIKNNALEFVGRSVRVLVYANKPSDAHKIADGLRRDRRVEPHAVERVATLTGTMRSHERNEMLESNPVFRALLNSEHVDETVYLVCTSAGEVGIDMDADMMVSESAPLDSLIQRAGRVNRRGENDETRLIVVHPDNVVARDKPSDAQRFDNQRAATIEYLEAKAIGGEVDMSPKAIAEMAEEVENLMSPTPGIVLPSYMQLESLSMTNADYLMERRQLPIFLHGDKFSLPETQVAWRDDVFYFDEAGWTENELGEWYRKYPIHSQETLSDHTDNVVAELIRIFECVRSDDEMQLKTFHVLDKRNASVGAMRVDNMDLKNTAVQDSLGWKTVILPSQWGGLSQDGLLDAKSKGQALDVSMEETPQSRWRKLPGGGAPPSGFAKMRRLALTTDESSEPTYVELYVKGRRFDDDDDDLGDVRQTLDHHSCLTRKMMSDICARLNALPALTKLLEDAAEWHDSGKARRVWQEYAGNENGSRALARSGKWRGSRWLRGYRHELGSMLDWAKSRDIENDFEDAEQALISHLIGSHHGYGRPLFTPRQYDKEENTTLTNRRTMKRHMRWFGHLNRIYGLWGLAWCEAVLRCADRAGIEGEDGV